MQLEGCSEAWSGFVRPPLDFDQARASTSAPEDLRFEYNPATRRCARTPFASLSQVR